LVARRFEDLRVWRLALELCEEIYGVSANGTFARDFGLKDQIRRSAVSVLSNIAEGFERDGDPEFRHFLFVAKGSCGEVRAQLYLAERLRYVDAPTFKSLHAKAMRTTKLLASLIKALEESNFRGRKYRLA
jgi:four helix bundle protein